MNKVKVNITAAEVKEAKEFIIEKLNYNFEKEPKKVYEPVSNLTKLAKYCKKLITLDHGIENKNSYMDQAINAAKYAHYIALQIKELLPELEDDELETSITLLRGLDVSYLNILSDQIKYKCPGGFWWRYLYKELESRHNEYTSRKRDEFIFSTFDFKKCIKDLIEKEKVTEGNYLWALLEKYEQYRRKMALDIRTLAEYSAYEIYLPAYEFGDIAPEDLGKLKSFKDLDINALNAYKDLSLKIWNSTAKNIPLVYLLEYCMEFADGERELSLEDFRMWYMAK